MRSWYGEHALKEAVLAHLDVDHERGSLSPIRIGDGEPIQYWYPERADFDAMRATFGIPRCVPAYGMETGGIIENVASAQYVVRAVRRFLRAVPIDAHVDWVPAELAALRLDDPEHGVITLVEGDVRIVDLLTRVAVALRTSPVDATLAVELLVESGHLVGHGRLGSRRAATVLRGRETVVRTYACHV